MPTSSIQLSANIVSFPINIDFDFKVNVKKDFVFLRYAPKFSGDEAGISFTNYTAIDPISNIVILDKTSEVPENSPFAPTESIKLTKTFSFTKGEFSVTDVFIVDSTGAEKPQYFKHTLNDVGFDLVDVEVLDAFFNPVPTDLYVYYDETDTLQYPSRHIYTNLRSSFDPIKKTFVVYYVRYKNPATSETFVDLLNPLPVFIEALFDTGSENRTYSIQSGYGENEIRIHFDTKNFSPTPSTTPRVAIKTTDQDRIFVEKPNFAAPNQKWDLRISNRSFFKNVAGIVEDEILWFGDGTDPVNPAAFGESLFGEAVYYAQDTFDLGQAAVISSSLIVYLDGEETEDYTLSVQTGPNETDQIIFDIPPTPEQEVKVSFLYDSKVAKYYIPEWNDQIFSPIRPYKFLNEHRAFVLGERLLYLEPNPISNLEIDGFYIYILQRDAAGAVVRALTNDPNADAYVSRSGEVTDVFYITDAIQSISELDGFIRLSSNLDINLDTFVTYRFIEKWYSYRQLEMNPSRNPDIRNTKAIIYIKPELSRTDLTGTVTQEIDTSIFHLLIDSSDNIVGANELDSFLSYEGIVTSGNTTSLVDTALEPEDIYSGFELEFLTGLHSGRRVKIDSYNTATQRLTLAVTLGSAIQIDTRYKIHKKYNSYSTFDSVSSTLFAYDGWKEVYTAHPNFNVILADARVVNNLALRDISFQDIRVRGGGIKDNSRILAVNAQREADWYWDIGYWDGKPYPGMASVLLEIPRRVLSERDGAFSKDQVKEIVHRHLADGYYPIVKYYDRSTTILNLEPADGSITVTWLDVDADEYNIYYGSSPELLDNIVTVLGTETSYELVDLNNNQVYYIKVEAVIDGLESLSSRIAKAVPFDLSAIESSATYGETLYGDGVYSSE